MNEEKTTDDFASEFVNGIKKVSDKRIELALRDRGFTNLDEVIQKINKEADLVIKKEVESVKKDMFVMFGIFASFIAFIVGEINILKTIDSIYDKLGFSFIFVALMLGFLFGIMFLVNNEKEFDQKIYGMRVTFLVFFAFGMLFIVMGKF